MAKRKFLFTFLISIWINCSNFIYSQIPDFNDAPPLTSGHYAPGQMNIRDMTTPSPGFSLTDYNVLLSGDEYYDEDGNEVTAINGVNGETDLNIDAGGYENNFSVNYAASLKILGEAVYFAGITPCYSTINQDLIYSRIVNIEFDTSYQPGNVDGKVSGFGDMTFLPLGLSWASQKFNLTFAYSIVAPTGKYIPGGSDNTGLGYWTNTFQAFGYYFPLKKNGIQTQSMALMLGGTFELNSKIKGVSVTPGSRFTIEYALSQYIGKRFEAGIGGGNNFQVGEDSGEDVWWNASAKDRESYVAFQLAAWPWINRLYTSLRYFFNYGLRQRVKEYTFEVNLEYAF